METELCAIAPEDWSVRSLEDVCVRVTSGGTPSRREPTYYSDGAWPWVKTQELQDKWIDRTEEFISERAVAESSAKVLPANTVLVAMYGATVGQLGLLRRPMTCNQACCALVVDENSADYRFVFYQLLHARSQLKNLATGAAQQNLSGALIRSLRFPYPGVTEQRAIAHILGTLDDKIELNRRMSETLEAMARSLFKSWFVDFDPVRAKQGGRQPEGMDAEMAALFPDGFEDSELGEVPRGWRAGTIRDEFNLTMGQSPPGETYNETGEGLPFYQGKTDFGFRFPKRRIYCTAPARLANVNDTLVSVRAPVGALNVANEPCAVGRGVAAIRHKSGSRSYTYYLIQTLAHEFAKYDGEGTVFGSINKSAFEAIPIVAPTAIITAMFEDVVYPIDEQIARNELESRTLATLRDALLPRLLSGELPV